MGQGAGLAPKSPLLRDEQIIVIDELKFVRDCMIRWAKDSGFPANEEMSTYDLTQLTDQLVRFSKAKKRAT